FQFLACPAGAGAGRHRSLWAAIAWSPALLTERDRALFRRLAVFRGGFDLEAAGVVADSSDVLAGVARLVDKSLVVSLATAGPPRHPPLVALPGHGRGPPRARGGRAPGKGRAAGGVPVPG